ncbi:MAG: hypothetical protein COB16_12705 [Rhodobacteraceae bacterium]|nr:MAG: hypothetical protein COB16_12705 [Paracoccaceae bacterium]
MMDNFMHQMLKDALTIAAEDGKGRISLAPDGHVCFGSNRLGSSVAKDWIEPEAFKDFLQRVRNRADNLLDDL